MQKCLNFDKSALTRSLRKTLAGLLGLAGCQLGLAQEAWYRVELSIFSNEEPSYRASEQWLPGRTQLDHPEQLTRLAQLSDVLVVESMLPDPIEEDTVLAEGSPEEVPLLPLESDATDMVADLPSAAELKKEAILAVGPHPKKPAPPFKFFDPLRDEFFGLKADQGDFAQTNRAITRSPDHRLLFHAVWQQPVLSKDEATSVYVQGGEIFGGQSELQGNLTIRFNENEDRVVLDTDIWLTEFMEAKIAASEDAGSANANLDLEQTSATSPVVEESEQATWVLPEIPNSLAQGPVQILQERTRQLEPAYVPEIVFHMEQSRPMRSNEFHYLDHPALGIVVLVQPYEIPPLPEATPDEIDSLVDQPQN